MNLWKILTNLTEFYVKNIVTLTLVERRFSWKSYFVLKILYVQKKCVQ